MHIRISLCIKFHFEQAIWNFWTKFTQEIYLYSETEKVNIIIEFHIFELALVPNFSLNWQFTFFTIYNYKQKKWTRLIFYIIFHIRISLVWNFSSNWQFTFFGPNFPKKVFPFKNWTREHHHWIPHIQISLGTKFQLKLKILIFFLTGFTQKGFFDIFCIILHIQISLVRNFN